MLVGLLLVRQEEKPARFAQTNVALVPEQILALHVDLHLRVAPGALTHAHVDEVGERHLLAGAVRLVDSRHARAMAATRR